MSGYKLHYFPFHGRAEPIRMMFAHKGMELENIVMSPADWKKPESKASVVGGALPNLICPDGEVLGHSTTAIMRMLGTEFGYYPTDPIAAYNCDFLLDLIHDFYNYDNYGKPYLSGDKRCAPKLIAAWNKYLGFMEEFVTNGKKWLCGSEITIADFFVGKFYCDMFTNPAYPLAPEMAKLMKKWPHFAAYGERYKTEMSSYLATRESRPI